MDILEDIVESVIIVIFPLLIYFIYSCYLNIKFKKFDTILLKIALITSFYLCIRNVYVVDDDRLFLLCNIPIILTYIKKEQFLGIVLSLTLINYCYFTFDLNIIILVLKYFLYFIIFLIYKRFKYSSTFLIEVIAILQGFFLSFEFFYTEHGGVIDIVNLFVIVAIFYLITFFSIFLINYADKITSLFSEVQELEKEKQLKNSLFKITHEIKNPIAVCKGYLDMLDINNQDKVSRYIPIISQEIDRCLNIMTDFMEFTKIKISKGVIDINVLLDEIDDEFRILLDNKKIKLNYIENEEDIYINGDYNRLKQVMLNILKNSLEAISESGEITVSSKVIKNNFFIEIKDNGCGMDADTLSNINELFFTTKKNGTGVGVSLSREIIIAHDGTIEYESKLGEGTKVIIKLPIWKDKK